MTEEQREGKRVPETPIGDGSDSSGRTDSAAPADSNITGDKKDPAPFVSDRTRETGRNTLPRSADRENAILRMLGLARRSRSLLCGTDAVISAVRSPKKPALVLAAADASPRTKKQLSDKCATYGVKLHILDADKTALAAAMGDKHGQCSACAVTDRNMANKIDSLKQAATI